MKLFTVNEERVTEGISVTLESYPHIGVGETGRGRKYIRFPVGHRVSIPEDQFLHRGSVIETRERGTLLLVEEKDSRDQRALVLVNIAAGFRGSTHWTAAREDSHEWYAFPPEGILVLAEGLCAEGGAGRMSDHAVRLLIMEPGSIFRVKRKGRLYGAPSERSVQWNGKELKLGTYDEIFPPSEEDLEGAELI